MAQTGNIQRFRKKHTVTKSQNPYQHSRKNVKIISAIKNQICSFV